MGEAVCSMCYVEIILATNDLVKYTITARSRYNSYVRSTLYREPCGFLAS